MEYRISAPAWFIAPSQEQDPACLPHDRSRDRTALVGLVIFAVGAVVWQSSGIERSLFKAPRRPGP